MAKPTWIAVITLTFIGGAVAWLIVRAPTRDSYVPRRAPRSSDGDYFRAAPWTDANDAVGRHPAAGARVASDSRLLGPDDDPEFLRALDRTIHGTS